MNAETLTSSTAAEIDVAVEQARLLSAMRGIVSDEHLAKYGCALLDRHLGTAAPAPSPSPDAPLSAHQFLLDKGMTSFAADLLTAHFSEAAAEASRKATGDAPQRYSALHTHTQQWGYEFTESDRAAMEIAWDELDPKPLIYRRLVQG